jgi:hypothetical protein
MTDQREVFTIVEDKTTAGLGVALKGKAEGDPVADIQMPVLACEDSSGNEAKIPLASDGGVAVTFASAGTKKRDSATVTPGALNTDTDVSVITLTATETYQVRFFKGSSFQPCEFRLEHDDNGTPDELARVVCQPGDNKFESKGGEDVIEFTAGATGTQELKIIGSQIRGPLSDMHGSVGILELP